MNTTKLLYLEDFSLLASEAKVLEVLEENGKIIIILDQTVFYPQGGGQPYDMGVIESLVHPDGRGSPVAIKFLVEEVRFIDGAVLHRGKFEQGLFQPGETVNLFVDVERRKLHSRLHSAGHVVDMGVNELGLNWTLGKGYHFPDGPYVEYAGSLEGVDKEKLKTDLENMANSLVEKGRQTKLLFMNKEEMKSVCRFVPDYIPEGKPGRVVMYGDFGVLCGGTHVQNLSEIGKMTIRKIKQEGPQIRVGYDTLRK